MMKSPARALQLSAAAFAAALTFSASAQVEPALPAAPAVAALPVAQLPSPPPLTTLPPYPPLLLVAVPAAEGAAARLPATFALATPRAMAAPAPPAQLQPEGAGQNSEVKDDLFAGTEVFAKNATDVTEINMDPASLDMVGGKRSANARSMVLNVVRTYSYDKPGMYDMAEVEKFRAKINSGDWRCAVHTRNMKTGSSSDVCNKQRTDGLRETAIITVDPKSLTFIHTIHREGGSSLGTMPFGPGSVAPMMAMLNGEALGDLGLALGGFGMGGTAAQIDAERIARDAARAAENEVRAANGLGGLPSAELQRSLDRFHSPEFQQQMDEMKKRLDSPEFKKEMEDFKKLLKSPEPQKPAQEDLNRSGAVKDQMPAA